MFMTWGARESLIIPQFLASQSAGGAIFNADPGVAEAPISQTAGGICVRTSLISGTS
jgi:hypothetical protein